MKGVEGFIHRIILGYTVDKALLYSMRKIEIVEKEGETALSILYDRCMNADYSAMLEYPVYNIDIIADLLDVELENYVCNLAYELTNFETEEIETIKKPLVKSYVINLE